jgi:hypothetical protein
MLPGMRSGEPEAQAVDATALNGGTSQRPPRAEGPWSDLALHTIGWKAFQDLCSQVCEEILKRPVQIFREAQDGGQDAVFLVGGNAGRSRTGTVQCKYSSDARARLRPSDLNGEFDAVRALVASGQADTYVLMTSMSVDGPVAATIRRQLQSLGVRKAHVFGRQYLVRTIRGSARLRALVPQVYGLGDLTAILDERTRQQTRALLDHWIPKLKRYVPTEAHRKAVRALEEHGIVLLLGNPASGKSAIGAVLSTLAADSPDRTVYTLTSPRDFEASWNPNDPSRFFWIDDAFGPNVVREEFVQDWTSVFTKVHAAISHGNRFLLTSRRHIYEAARLRLGQRNLPAFLDNSAVVDVGQLTHDEKRQILYNHIAFGNQTQAWKTSVKPHLDAVAIVDDFLPGIAERLGDPAFTKNIAPTVEALTRFMTEPKTHLIDTLNALDEPLRAALLLVYVHEGTLNALSPDPDAVRAVVESTAVQRNAILEALPQLRGSFLRTAMSDTNTWRFAHPTIADALTEILKGRPHMVAAFVHGATIDTVLSNCVCEGAEYITDALRIPEAMADVLVSRLARTPDEIVLNERLLSFVATRTTDGVLMKALERAPAILDRHVWSLRTATDPLLHVAARAHRLGCLDAEKRERLAERLEKAVVEDGDLSCLEAPDILALIPPLRLLALGMNIQANLLPSVKSRIEEAADDFDPDHYFEGAFDKWAGGIAALEELEGLDSSVSDLLQDAREALERGEDVVRERLAAERGRSDERSRWKDMAARASSRSSGLTGTEPMTRSVFDDVDHSEGD